MDDPHLLDNVVVTLLSFAVLGGLFVLARRKFERDAEELSPVSKLLRVPPSAIANVEPDTVARIAGVATPQAPVEQTKFGGRPYVAYWLEIAIAGGDWRRELRHARAFYVDDESGRALVQPACAVLELGKRSRGSCTPDELPAAVREWIEEETCSDDWREARHLHWSEGWIEPGERACVVGAATLAVDEQGAAGDYRQSAELLTFAAAEPRPLSVSNDPKLLATA